ncbi:E3 ubiquitin-protein ligase SH3RF3 isoform X4 [Pipistrellus kuhlii]|uniref:E3 ubiquitin-protein ligase SH3RF3 isoform X4 n=1 Tax=Pipistrellus kuhlii TaxID=59472 RepID=UPI001E270703|nr:E3 ubiquitin-protein ligase SH3RF3 isoform X4 [Pipistrellus kuhlii]
MLLGGPGLCASQAAAAAAAQSEGDHDRPGELWRWQRATGEDMDESSLLDLLECSVCLERLDTTAKVLPCQHTFCRRCLESILCSRRELRCPECRILVGCGVDELPANILLVRLLDGIRQRPRAGASPGGSPPAPSGPGWGAASELAGGGGRAMGSAPGSPVFPLEAGSPHELTTSRNAPLAKNPSQLPCGKALYSYEGKEPGDLKFNKGDVIILRRRVDEHWFHGELRGAHGFLPASYVQCLRPLPPVPPQGKALYDFEMKDRDQDHDCLTFTKDEILTVIRRVDDNWAEGMLGDKIGIFPLLYVEDSSSGSSPAAEQQDMAPKGQLPLNVYLALYTYKPQKSDELELRKGEMYYVLEKCQDGWFKGTSLRSGLSGVFPGNYVTPASRAPLGGAGPPGNNVVGGSPLAKGMATSIHPRSGSMSSPATALRAALPLTTPQAQHQAASLPVGSCLWHSASPAASQARSTVPTAAHSSAQAQDQPTTMVSPLCTQNSPSRLPTASRRPHSTVSLQHLHQPPVQTIGGAQCPWPAIPLTSAASAVTPPNVTAANLNGEAGVGTVSGLSTSSPTNVRCKPDEKKTEKKEKKSGLLKLLAGASTKKKSRSPPSISPTHNSQVAVDASLQGAVGLEVSSLSLHGRAGSCPIDSKIQGAMGMEPLHRKTGSLDLNFSSPSRQAPFSMAAARPEPKPLPRERYRVVVSYPPQSEAEIELKEGDIVFVHKKREDGWYKGTLQRNGRTGLFPGSFVESF